MSDMASAWVLGICTPSVGAAAGAAASAGGKGAAAAGAALRGAGGWLADDGRSWKD